MVTRIVEGAGAEALTAKVAPGDSVVQALGGRTPSGVPVPDAVWRPVLEGGKNGGRRGGSRPGWPAREPRSRLVRWRASSSELRAARRQPGQNGRVSQTHTTGQLLVATPQIEEGVFRRSVVLVLHHDDDGAQGLVLNRPIDADVDAVLPGWEEHATRPAKVFQGGPVQLDSALGLVAVPGDSPEPTGVRRLFGAVALVDLDTPPTLVVPEVAGLRIFAGLRRVVARPARGARSSRGRGSSSTARATTSSPASPTTCGAGCCAASPSRCAGWPGSRATRSLN